MRHNWKRICPLCNKEFISYAPARKFCSDECFKEHRRIYNNEKTKRYWAEGRIKRDPQKQKISNHKFYLKHKKDYAERSRRWRLENKEKKLAMDRKYYQEHKKENSIKCKEYAKNHREQINAYHREWNKNHPMSIFIDRLRSRIYKAIKGQAKELSTMKLISCSSKFLKQYLQNKFKEGMTWDNYGKWHVDHIKSCAKFDLSKTSEQKKCFHYTNLQPLWARDNIIKGDK